MQSVPKIVIDTNVLVAALRSRSGRSFELLMQLDQGRYQPVVTVPLVMEYEDVLLRPGMVPVAPAAVTASSTTFVPWPFARRCIFCGAPDWRM